MLQLGRLGRLFVLIGPALAFVAGDAAAELKEGSDYVVISPAQPTGADTLKGIDTLRA